VVTLDLGIKVEGRVSAVGSWALLGGGTASLAPGADPPSSAGAGAWAATAGEQCVALGLGLLPAASISATLDTITTQHMAVSHAFADTRIRGEASVQDAVLQLAPVTAAMSKYLEPLVQQGVNELIAGTHAFPSGASFQATLGLGGALSAADEAPGTSAGPGAADAGPAEEQTALHVNLRVVNATGEIEALHGGTALLLGASATLDLDLLTAAASQQDQEHR